MNDVVDAVERTRHRITVGNRVAHELDPFRVQPFKSFRQCAVNLSNQRVQDANTVAANKQFFGQMRAYETGAAGQEY